MPGFELSDFKAWLHNHKQLGQSSRYATLVCEPDGKPLRDAICERGPKLVAKGFACNVCHTVLPKAHVVVHTCRKGFRLKAPYALWEEWGLIHIPRSDNREVCKLCGTYVARPGDSCGSNCAMQCSKGKGKKGACPGGHICQSTLLSTYAVDFTDLAGHRAAWEGCAAALKELQQFEVHYIAVFRHPEVLDRDDVLLAFHGLLCQSGLGDDVGMGVRTLRPLSASESVPRTPGLHQTYKYVGAYTGRVISEYPEDDSDLACLIASHRPTNMHTIWDPRGTGCLLYLLNCGHGKFANVAQEVVMRGQLACAYFAARKRVCSNMML